MRLLLVILLFTLASACPGQSYFLNGDAQAGANNCYVITPNVAWQNGTVWYADQLNLNESFTLEFLMTFGSVDANGADGMVFVLQTAGTNAIGSDGSGMGFQGFNPSFGIEFDTFSNSETNDPSSDHIAFLKNGVVDHNNPSNLAGPVQASATSANIEDGQDHIVKIVWNAPLMFIEIYFDCVLRQSYGANIVNTIFNGNPNVYWGFTGATGFYYNQQSVCLQETYFGEASDSTICQGQSMQLTAPGNTAGQFEWTPAAGLDNPAIQTPVATPAATTEYCYTYTDLCNQTFTGCVVVNVEDYPSITAGADTFFCAGLSMGLYGVSANPDAILSWTTTDGNILNSSNTPSPQVNATGTYVMHATSPVAGCASVDEVMVEEHPLPIITVDTTAEFCPGESITLDAGPGWDEVMWGTGDFAQTIEVNTPGDYELVVTENSCWSSVFITVSEIDMPILDLGPDQELCDGSSATLDAGVVVNWNTGANAETITVSQSGVYSALYTNQGCETQDEVSITTVPMPLFELGPDQILCDGESYTASIPYVGTWSNGTVGSELEITQSGDYAVVVVNGPCMADDGIHVDVLSPPIVMLGDDVTFCVGTDYFIGVEQEDAASYVWNTGDETSMLEIHEAGDYILTASNFCGADTDSIYATLDDCTYYLYIPNAFSPDGDGLNDVFHILYFNLKWAHLDIFNRWGDPVFHSDDLNEVWTGDVHGGEYYAQDNVYNFHVLFETEQGDIGEKWGHIILVR